MAYTAYNTTLGIQSFETAQSLNTTAPYTIGFGLQGAGANTLNQVVDAWDPVLGAGRFIYTQGAATNTSGATISSITVAANGFATVTTSSAHSLLPNTRVVLSGVVPTAYNGTYSVIATPSTTTFTIQTSNVTVAATTVGSYVYGTIRQGAIVAYTQSIVNGVVSNVATLWDGTSNTGRSLGIAYTSMLAGEFGWVQLQGLAVANAAALSGAGNPIYYGGAAGYLSTGVTAGKQIMNAQSASALGATIGTGSAAITLPNATTTSSQGLVYINNPFAQGAIT